ncbi:MAG: hypothetical protein NT001_07440, partial [Candidatus Woesearchaeota archaeon]|nr:hypothetical protein [Candidatus Woesearchaeota archaeon]
MQILEMPIVAMIPVTIISIPNPCPIVTAVPVKKKFNAVVIGLPIRSIAAAVLAFSAIQNNDKV